ncbi:MAG: hypothetical protein R3Y58_04605 [Eubacteriales bacterium]
MTSDLDLFFGLVGVACGLFCLYSAIRMRRTGIITESLLLDKETAKKPCKDIGTYLVEVIPPTVIMGIVLLIYGVLTLVDAYVYECYMVVMIMMVITLIALVWFGFVTSKAKKKYF